jgi:HSP90 family molecular chaperone
MCAPIKEHKKYMKHDPPKSKRRISKQRVLRKINKKYSTHLHIPIKLHD